VPLFSPANAAVAIALAALLGSCSSPPADDAPQKPPAPVEEPEPAATETAAPEPVETVDPTPLDPVAPTPDPAETGFLLNISHDPLLAVVDPQDLLTLGLDVCTSLDGGATLAETKPPVLAVVGDPDSTDLLTRSAGTILCDRHDAAVEIDFGGVADPQPDPEGTTKDTYLAAVRSIPGFVDDTVSDEMLLFMGTTYCDGFTRGDSLETSLGYLEPYAVDAALAFLDATTEICPEHRAMVP
jgi:hypothetical protein